MMHHYSKLRLVSLKRSHAENSNGGENTFLGSGVTRHVEKVQCRVFDERRQISMKFIIIIIVKR